MITAIWGSSYFGGGCSADEKKQNQYNSTPQEIHSDGGEGGEWPAKGSDSDLPGTFLEDMHPATQQGFMILCDASCTH